MASENAIIERAETYLRKLSCGVNPLTDEILPEGDCCRQERIYKNFALEASIANNFYNNPLTGFNGGNMIANLGGFLNF